jgi:hypothetical protein
MKSFGKKKKEKGIFFFMYEEFIRVPPLDVHCKKAFK